MFELCIDTDVFYCGGEALYDARYDFKLCSIILFIV